MDAPANHNIGSAFNSSGDTGGANSVHGATIGAQMTAGDIGLEIDITTKTGSPGSVYPFGPALVWGRYIG